MLSQKQNSQSSSALQNKTINQAQPIKYNNHSRASQPKKKVQSITLSLKKKHSIMINLYKNKTISQLKLQKTINKTQKI
jgi:hypothetical protein